MGWSMDRRGIRTLFDRESGRLKQIELSGLRGARLSLSACIPMNSPPARSKSVRKPNTASGASDVVIKAETASARDKPLR